MGKEGCVQIRTILWYLVFFGFGVNYMIRINLNIAIVDMVVQQKNSVQVAKMASECSPLSLNQTIENITEVTIVSNQNENNDRFEWNEYEQSLILGSFFWLHWITQIPGGICAQKYGTKIVFGLSNLAGALLSFFIPIVSYWDYKWLVFIRVLQGLITGFSWPAMHNLTAKWIPPNERGKFVSAYLGSSVGAALTYPLCGLLISRWNWHVVFYVCAAIGSVWYIFWSYFVYDSPGEHPQISDKEREHIEQCLGASVASKKNKAPTPWRSILTSVPIWINIAAQWGGVWGLFTLMTHSPTYFKHIHGWDIRMTGFLSGLPHLVRMLFSFISSTIGDYLLRTEKMSRTNVRKLAASICTMGQGCCMLGLAFSGCNKILAIILVTAATGSHGAVSSGPLASLIDLSPNYAAITFGLCNTIVVPAGFFSAQLIGLLTLNNQTAERWKWVFLIAAAKLYIVGLLYVFLGNSDLQSWNNPYQPVSTEQELVKIPSKDNDKKKLDDQELHEETENLQKNHSKAENNV